MNKTIEIFNSIKIAKFNLINIYFVLDRKIKTDASTIC